MPAATCDAAMKYEHLQNTGLIDEMKIIYIFFTFKGCSTLLQVLCVKLLLHSKCCNM